MRANRFIFWIAMMAVALAMGGCADSRRFLPGGVVKVRDLSKGRPVNPGVLEEIEAVETAARAAPYPILSDQPSAGPARRTPADIQTESRDILDAGAALERSLAADRVKADAERAVAQGPSW